MFFFTKNLLFIVDLELLCSSLNFWLKSIWNSRSDLITFLARKEVKVHLNKKKLIRYYRARWSSSKTIWNIIGSQTTYIQKFSLRNKIWIFFLSRVELFQVTLGLKSSILNRNNKNKKNVFKEKETKDRDHQKIDQKMVLKMKNARFVHLTHETPVNPRLMLIFHEADEIYQVQTPIF